MSRSFVVWRTMMNDEERRRFSDNSILETITEQQDDEILSSPMSQNSSVERNHFLDGEKQRERDREEMENFEALEKEFASSRHGVRVTFAYPVDHQTDDDHQQILSMKQTTVVKTEPCFQIQSREDQVTKHFYENSFPKSSSSKTPSEHDSLEEEMNKPKLNKNHCFEPVSSLSSPSSSSAISPTKSILKKSSKHDEQLNRSHSRSPSPATKKKLASKSKALSSNEFSYLAEITAKQQQRNSSSSYPPRSLFEPTINIFDSVTSSCPVNNIRRRPSRLRYYIKPYRGEANLPPEKTSKHRSRSLSEQRMAQQMEPTTTTTTTTQGRWYTFSNQYGRPSQMTNNRKQHVSWSPVREYIHEGRDPHPKNITEKKSLVLSSSNPCLPSSTISTTPSMIPISVRYRTTRVTAVPQHFRQSFPPVLMDSYETCSVPDPSLTPITPLSQVSQYEEQQRSKHSPLPDVVYQHSKEHDETMQRYDRLLEKMRTTDEQLQQLTRSWNNQTSTKSTPVTHSASIVASSSSSSVNKSIPTSNETFLSPSFLQLCLLILVLLNLIFIYFFNDINYWWTKYVNYAVVLQHHDRSTTHIS